jgi:hypothetical protein
MHILKLTHVTNQQTISSSNQSLSLEILDNLFNGLDENPKKGQKKN